MTDRRVAPSRRGFLRLGAGAAAAAGLAGCTTLADPASSDFETAATAQFRGGLERHGYQTDGTVPDDVEVAWSHPVNTGDHTAAKASFVHAPADAVRAATGDEDAGDRLVVPGDDGTVRAFTPDGELLWASAIQPASRGIHGTPAVAGGLVYIGGYDGGLYAFDLGSGERVWRRKLGDAIGSSPAYHDGDVYIAVEYYTPSGGVFGVDAATGGGRWGDRRVTDHPHSTIAIDRDAGRLVVGSNDGYLYAWSYPELEFQWRFETGDAIKGPVATYDGGAFFGSWDRNVYRVDLADGTEDWAFGTNGLVMSGPAIDVGRGVCYVGSHDGNLYALDADEGTELWRFGTGGRVVGCPVTTGTRVVCGSKDRSVYALDTSDGTEVWSLELDGWVTSTPLVTGRGIYVAERAPEGADGPPGHAYALRPA
ncbi:PQQ-binding-like beta-propeller repeat protein [Haloglomus litoreum]|uniref:outer membrane protein assembly factor BamB family protein n=1 Tax=Haloglomus litoreum TaxID=3034026 RepID=UPI0023E8E525|nr:PQQ-binding-like beta-propeller repeat protein [Haloglomus sp. DT116]